MKRVPTVHTVDEEISDSLDSAGPSRFYRTSPKDDTSTPVEAKCFISLAEVFNPADNMPRFTMAHILHYFFVENCSGWPTPCQFKIHLCVYYESFPGWAHSANSGQHHKLLLIDFKGVCRAEMKKKVQYSIAFIISCVTSAITMLCVSAQPGKGPLATCKHIGALLAKWMVS